MLADNEDAEAPLPAYERDAAISSDSQRILEGIPRVGDLVLAGKYRIETIIGMGGMGLVVAATHVTLRHVVALKFLLKGGKEAWEDSIERFLREARAVANLQSEHVVRVMDVGVLESGVPFMLMEYLTGLDLAAYIRENGPMGTADAVGFTLQACEAIAAAHAAGIVHRDLKPSNFFLCQRADGSLILKVLDFGISKVKGDDEAELKLSLTRPGAMLGSPMYMSPEQIRNSKHVDHRSDIWALGVVLFEALTGASLFDGESFAGLCAAIVSDRAQSVRALRPDVPDALERVILRCVEKDPARRFQDAAELALALAPFGPQPEAVGSAARTAKLLSGAWRPNQSSPDGRPSSPLLGSARPGGGSAREGFSSHPSRVRITGAGVVASVPSATHAQRRRHVVAFVVFASFFVFLGGTTFVLYMRHTAVIAPSAADEETAPSSAFRDVRAKGGYPAAATPGVNSGELGSEVAASSLPPHTATVAAANLPPATDAPKATAATRSKAPSPPPVPRRTQAPTSTSAPADAELLMNRR